MMKTIPYRCETARHKALLAAARDTGTSVQKMLDNCVTNLLAERHAEARFLSRKARGNPTRGRKLLTDIMAR